MMDLEMLFRSKSQPHWIFIAGVLFVALATVIFLKLDGQFPVLPKEASPTAEKALSEGDRQAILAPSTDIGAQSYEALITTHAVESSVLTIGPGCAMDPLVLKLAKGTVLTVKNNDSADHVIAFEDQNFFSVSASQTRELNFTEIFGKDPGIYRYRCSDTSLAENVGAMYVTE